jgi:hypothetical protein
MYFTNTKIRQSTIYLPVIAVFSVVYGFIRFIPIIPWIGGSGFFTLADFFIPFIAILFGPYVSSLIIVIGTVIGFLSGRISFFGLDFFPAVINALVIGFMVRKKRTLSICLFSILIICFFIHPFTMKFVEVKNILIPFIWMHLIAYLLLLSPLSRRSVLSINKIFTSENFKGLKIANYVFSFAIISFVGSLAQHIAGNLIFATVSVSILGMTLSTLFDIWKVVFFIYPFERIIISCFASIICIFCVPPLIKTKKIRLFLT